MTRLILIRHGQTPSNVAGLLDTDPPGPGLTELGERQAAAIPGVLDGRPVATIAVSNLVRTQRTAAPLAAERGLAPIVLDGLAEVRAADLEDRSDEASVRIYLETVFAWVKGDTARRMPGADTDGADFLRRYDAAISEAVEAASAPGSGTPVPEPVEGPRRGGDGLVVVVSHGAAIRCWTGARVRGVDLAVVERASLPNTSMVEIEGSVETGWDLVSWTATPAGGVGIRAAVTADDPTGQPVADA